MIQIELGFVERNNLACSGSMRASYEKMGFKIIGVKPNTIRLKDV